MTRRNVATLEAQRVSRELGHVLTFDTRDGRIGHCDRCGRAVFIEPYLGAVGDALQTPCPRRRSITRLARLGLRYRSRVNGSRL